MSTNENTPVEAVEDDLDAFTADFFGQKEVVLEPANSEADGDSNAESDATEEDTQNDETDTLETETDDEEVDEDDEGEDSEEDEESDEEEDKPEEAPKKPKSRFQERIDELNAKYREEERQRKSLEARLAELEAQRNTQPKDEKTNPPVEVNQGPTPDDKNEDGTDKYPLGEFDPGYIRDLTKHTLQQEREALRKTEEQERSQKEQEAQRQALEQDWQQKLGTAQERYPDFQEKSENLVDSFGGLEPAYGEYLAATLMSMDHGPDVLYYLANNPDEASKIVQSGATKATIALGRLEAKFADAEVEKTKARPKVSKAPEPPTTRLKGSTAVIPEVPDDTDDLEAFEQKLFTKKRK